MKAVRLSLLAGVSLCVLCSTRTALADAAPPPPPPGTTLAPGESITNVQMLWEDVLMTVSDDRATVQAVFRFQNQGTETESFNVRFPLGVNTWSRSQFGPITDFVVLVDGVPAAITNIQEPDALSGEAIPWATWPTTFPPGVRVEISVTYTISAYHENNISALDEYSYILNTGAGWYGAIGEGTITVRLPYDVNQSTLCAGSGCLWQPRPGWYTIAGTDVVWHFTNLEPTVQDDIVIVALDPELYRSLLDARAQTQLSPDSLDAQIYLARLIRPAVSAECGGYFGGCGYSEGPTTDLIAEALSAYRNALELAPRDVDLNAEYLEFLITSTGYPDEIADEFIPRLEYALTLDPDNERLLRIRYVLQELDLLPAAASGRATPPGMREAPTAAAPSLIQTPTPYGGSAGTGSMATESTLVTAIAPSPGDRAAAWLIILSVLILAFIGTAGVIIIVLRKII